jgi:Xaa-Pro aminopeptidase
MIDSAVVGSLELIRRELEKVTEDDYTNAYGTRLQRFAAQMASTGIDAAVLTFGAEVPWLIGYEPMPLERVTALVLRADERPVLVVPELEAPRVRVRDDLFELLPWSEGDDPFVLLERRLLGAREVAVSDRGWSSWTLTLMERLDSATHFQRASVISTPLRRCKDDVEMLTLAAAAAAADEVALLLQSGEVAFGGRRERDLSEEIARHLVATGHREINFAIVGSGPNSASPHHEASDRRMARGDLVVCDFGGTYCANDEPGYCSDTTRTFSIGEPSREVTELFEVLFRAQERVRSELRPGMSLESADMLARRVIDDAGYGKYFIHRLGHGIGLEEHEEPYLAPGSRGDLEPGDAFSIEPGIYVPGHHGARIEDIAIATEDGVISLNISPRQLVTVE